MFIFAYSALLLTSMSIMVYHASFFILSNMTLRSILCTYMIYSKIFFLLTYLIRCAQMHMLQKKIMLPPTSFRTTSAHFFFFSAFFFLYIYRTTILFFCIFVYHHAMPQIYDRIITLRLNRTDNFFLPYSRGVCNIQKNFSAVNRSFIVSCLSRRKFFTNISIS